MPGFVHLALGDPLQKRHYYRAGWIKFTDDADMSKAVTQVGEKKVRWNVPRSSPFLLTIVSLRLRGLSFM